MSLRARVLWVLLIVSLVGPLVSFWCLDWDEPESRLRRDSFNLAHPPCAPTCGPERPY